MTDQTKQASNQVEGAEPADTGEIQLTESDLRRLGAYRMVARVVVALLAVAWGTDRSLGIGASVAAGVVAGGAAAALSRIETVYRTKTRLYLALCFLVGAVSVLAARAQMAYAHSITATWSADAGLHTLELGWTTLTAGTRNRIITSATCTGVGVAVATILWRRQNADHVLQLLILGQSLQSLTVAALFETTNGLPDSPGAAVGWIVFQCGRTIGVAASLANLGFLADVVGTRAFLRRHAKEAEQP